MAARTKGKPKQAGSARPTTKTAAKRAATAAKTPRTKSAAKKARKPKPATGPGDTETALLRDHNEALRTELEQARARIQQLEEVNKNVVNRIDWVIDSLQSVLKR